MTEICIFRGKILELPSCKKSQVGFICKIIQGCTVNKTYNFGITNFTEACVGQWISILWWFYKKLCEITAACSTKSYSSKWT